MIERLPFSNKRRQSVPTISRGLTVGDSYDYRVTVELINGRTKSGKS